MMEPIRRAIRILLVDDHALFRDSVSRALASEPDIQIQHCGSIREAISLLAQQRFHVVLLDHDLGSERASQFLPAARQTGFEGRVLVVTAWVSETEGRRLMRQGVSGIFLKEGPLDQLLDAIRTVAGGGTWLDRSFAPLEGQEMVEPAASPVFNERQRRVLRFVLEGLSNKEIAWRLQISESYVKAILQSLFHKTGVRTRGQLVRVAFEQYEDQL
ncbi:MAG TPA: response regulator transcription factor [Bryobacteraceae bacterium]|jgi:DNA-binding NarL/FixJ family response regulator|nr:response regulator transcription factor [Bryobacteraceae bacterium]